MLVTNDPWLCAGHLFDIAVVTPVFRDGRVAAIVGTVGHVADIGGTKDSLNAREIYEEGLQIPPMKLFRAGVPNEDLLTLVAENVRKHEQVLGDIHSLVAANALGARRLLDFMAEYGMHDLEPLATVVQNRSESAMREAIRARAGRRVRERDIQRPLGTPLRYRDPREGARATRSSSTSPTRRRRRRAAAPTAPTTTPPPTRPIR